MRSASRRQGTGRTMADAEWRFLDTGAGDASLNMAVDEVILESHLQGLSPPTLRVYRWKRPAISLGYFQDMDAEIEVGWCRESGVDVVRRLTGGRAILHDDELTYSVVTSEGYGSPRSLAESYRHINQGLVAAYGSLGLEVRLEAHPRGPSSTACFSSAGIADLTFQGRKVCGSAQYRRGGALLQHGSLPISADVRLLFSMLTFPSNAVRERAREEFDKRATCLSDLLGRKTPAEELARAVFRGFELGLGIQLRRESLTAMESSESHTLAAQKYQSTAWNRDGQY
jgi:lipoate-protein ligase A